MAKHSLEVLPKGWVQQQCAKCKMVFALPPISGDSDHVKADKIVHEELLAHFARKHEDFSQAAARVGREATKD